MKRVGALIIKGECLLLNENLRYFANKYSFPNWEIKKGFYPVEYVNSKLKDSFGIKAEKTIYIEMVKFNRDDLYLYKIKDWKTVSVLYAETCTDDISRMVWVHKDVLLNTSNSIYFDNEYINKIFD